MSNVYDDILKLTSMTDLWMVVETGPQKHHETPALSRNAVGAGAGWKLLTCDPKIVAPWLTLTFPATDSSRMIAIGLVGSAIGRFQKPTDKHQEESVKIEASGKSQSLRGFRGKKKHWGLWGCSTVHVCP